MREWVDPASIVGRTLDEVIVGWHCFGEQRAPVLVFLRFGSEWLEACTAADASVRLDRTSQPLDFDMAESGRFEMHPADERHPLHSLIGAPVVRVQHLWCEGIEAGLVLAGDQHSIIVANAGDELVITTGEVPPGFVDAVIAP